MGLAAGCFAVAGIFVYLASAFTGLERVVTTVDGYAPQPGHDVFFRSQAVDVSVESQKNILAYISGLVRITEDSQSDTVDLAAVHLHQTFESPLISSAGVGQKACCFVFGLFDRQCSG